jgi:muramoyltetrapeptide carboxypeptidase
VSGGFAALPPGSLIGVIAPAGPPNPERVALVEPMFAAHGYRVRLYPGCSMQEGEYLAGPDAARLADLHAAFADDEVAAIHCIRGGYGCLRLLDRIDADLMRRHPKLLMGYSDITALHALLATLGIPSLHAPMAASDIVRPGREADRDALFALLRGGCVAGTVLAPALGEGDAATTAALRVPGVAEGRLVGGNLSMVAHLLGTPWAWDARGAIVFLEDVSEEPYRVDRYLTQMRLAGVLDAAAGFVLGSFTDQASPLPQLAEALRPLGKPVLGGWPTGHGTPNRPLPLGLRARLDAGAGTLTLLESLLQAA